MAWKACELSNLVGTLIAFVMSIAAMVIYCFVVTRVELALAAAGQGTDILRKVVRAQDFILGLTLSLNIVATLAIGLSTFHITSCQSTFTHNITSSKALCIMRVLAAVSFFAQAVNVQFFMVILVALRCMSYICDMGHPVIYQTQQLVYSIGNWTVSGSGPDFNPWGPPNNLRKVDTPLISLKSVIRHLDMYRYCDLNSKNLENAVLLFWLACFLTVVSQALMTVTINGEKERVYIHELQEEANNFAGVNSMAMMGKTQQYATNPYSAVNVGQVSTRSFAPLLGGSSLTGGNTYH